MVVEFVAAVCTTHTSSVNCAQQGRIGLVSWLPAWSSPSEPDSVSTVAVLRCSTGSLAPKAVPGGPTAASATCWCVSMRMWRSADVYAIVAVRSRCQDQVALGGTDAPCTRLDQRAGRHLSPKPKVQDRLIKSIGPRHRAGVGCALEVRGMSAVKP